MYTLQEKPDTHGTYASCAGPRTPHVRFLRAIPIRGSLSCSPYKAAIFGCLYYFIRILQVCKNFIEYLKRKQNWKRIYDCWAKIGPWAQSTGQGSLLSVPGQLASATHDATQPGSHSGLWTRGVCGRGHCARDPHGGAPSCASSVT
jgi:hypothetical protein